MIRKIAMMTAVLGALAGLGATGAGAMDDVIRTSTGFPIWVDGGVYGYYGGQWILYDTYRNPNGTTTTKCHAAGSPTKTSCPG